MFPKRQLRVHSLPCTSRELLEEHKSKETGCARGSTDQKLSYGVMSWKCGSIFQALRGGGGAALANFGFVTLGKKTCRPTSYIIQTAFPHARFSVFRLFHRTGSHRVRCMTLISVCAHMRFCRTLLFLTLDFCKIFCLARLTPHQRLPYLHWGLKLNLHASS